MLKTSEHILNTGEESTGANCASKHPLLVTLFALAIISCLLAPLLTVVPAQAATTLIASEEQTESLPDASTVEPLDPRDYVPAIDIDEQKLKDALAMAHESQRGGYRSRHHRNRSSAASDDTASKDPVEATVDAVTNASEIVAIFTGIGLAVLAFAFLKRVLSPWWSKWF